MTVYKHPKEPATLYYQKGKSKKLFMSYYVEVNGKRTRKQKTTNTEDLEEAKQVLQEQLIFNKLVKEGRFEVTETKKVSCKTAILETIKDIESLKIQKSVYKRYIEKLNILIELIGHIDIRKLSFNDFKPILQEPRSETQQRYFKTAIRRFLEYSLHKNYIDRIIELPKPAIKQRNKREGIEDKQVDLLTNRFMLKAGKTRGDTKRNNAFLTWKLIRFLYLTGLRLGEATNIKYKNVKVNNEDNNSGALVLIEKSKTRTRKILVDTESRNILTLLLELKKDKDKETYVFSRIIDNIVPDFSGIIQRDREENPDWYEENNLENFVLYQLRHSFINKKIIEGKDLLMIAQHCGTSLEMIQKNYLDQIVNRDIENIYTKESFLNVHKNIFED